MILGDKQMEKLLSEAKRSVRLLGVVALDADWDSLAGAWTEQFKKNQHFEIEILCESDNMLFTKAFTSDSDVASDRRSFEELKFIRDRALELGDLLSAERGLKDQTSGAIHLSIEIMHLAIPISLVEVDGSLYANLWLHEIDRGFEEIKDGHEWQSLLQRYIETYFDPKQGRKYAGVPDTELLELFDHNRIPRGIFPRSSFYDTDYSQLVVWALVFDRQGRLLIHRRADNAEDNRSMWDKSVGGHVDFSLDVDTSRGVLREVIEELFSDETKEKSQHFTAWAVTDDEMIYVGEWRPKQRRRSPFLEISTFGHEWAFFRLKNSPNLYSPREMPDGSMKRLRMISDVFLFVAGPGLTDENLGNLKNSEFKLIELPDLKNVMDRALRNEEVQDFDPKYGIPRFSPDLTNIMTGELRGVLEEFSQYVKRYVSN
jgi:hypothetical protein